MAGRLFPQRRWILYFSVFFMVPAMCMAKGLTDNLKKDFKSISGYIIMVRGNEYIIDQGRASGVKPGDLFSIVRPGKKLTHPVTGKFLGRLEQTIGVIKLVRMDNDYSFARPVGKIKSAKRGDLIKRWANIKAKFIDKTGEGKPLYLKVRDALPFLKWEGYEKGAKSSAEIDDPLLIFILKKNTLEIKDNESYLIGTYNIAGDMNMQAPLPPAVKPVKDESRPPFPKVKKSPGVSETKVQFKAEYEKYQSLGSLPGVVLSGDFTQYDGMTLLASCEAGFVHIFNVKDKPINLTEIDTGKDRVLVVRWWRPVSEKEPFLIVTAWNDEDPVTMIYKLKNNRLDPFIKRISYFLAPFDKDGDGLCETLLRQEFDREIFWGRKVREVRLEGENLKTVDTAMSLPPEFTITGSIFADMTGDGKPENIFVRGSVLYIYSGKKMLFKSPGMGGSIAYITYDINPDQQVPQNNTVSLEIAPLAADIDNDGHPEIIAVASNKSPVSIPSVYSGFKNSLLAVFKYENGNFIKGTIGDDLNLPVQATGFDRKRLLFIETTLADLGGQGGSSSLNAIPME